MKNSEETHRLTEAVYRGLTENFNPGVKQLILTGKAYHKALQGVTASARAFAETLLRVGSVARETCRGGTEDVGNAIFQIAEAQKEIQLRLEENTKALFTELILPLEQKLENEFKRAAGQHRKYIHGHKTTVGPYVKAAESLRKFRKKTKNKVVYDERKEEMHIQTLGRYQEKLDDFRVQGLKLALLEERKCHCFLLERLTTVAGMQTSLHRQANDMLGMGLPRWKQLASKPHLLPPEANRILTLPRDDEPPNTMNGSLYRIPNGIMADETRSLGSPYRRSHSAHDGPRRPLDSYDGEMAYTKTLPHSRGISVPPPAPLGSTQVRALYTHVDEGDSKLSFTEGDIINLVGEKTDGWHYGLNTRSGRYGWFPLSFTESLSGYTARDHNSMSHRARSMGDLDNRSLSDGESLFVDQDVPGAFRRPRSLYESSGLKLVNNPTQPYSSGDWSTDTSANMLGSYSLPRRISADRGHYFPSHFGYSPPEYDSHRFSPSDAQSNHRSSMKSSSGSTGGDGSNSRQMTNHSAFPPPPPPSVLDTGMADRPRPPSTAAPTPPGYYPTEDYGTDDEDSNYKRNPKFAAVNLRSTVTNDRSKPRI